MRTLAFAAVAAGVLIAATPANSADKTKGPAAAAETAPPHAVTALVERANSLRDQLRRGDHPGLRRGVGHPSLRQEIGHPGLRRGIDISRGLRDSRLGQGAH